MESEVKERSAGLGYRFANKTSKDCAIIQPLWITRNTSQLPQTNGVVSHAFAVRG